MNNADRIIAIQKCIKSARATAEAAKDLDAATKRAAVAADAFSKALWAALPHQYEQS